MNNLLETNLEQTVSIDAASVVLGMTPHKIRLLSSSGQIPSHKTEGGHLRFKFEDMYNFLLPPKVDREVFKQLVSVSCQTLQSSLSASAILLTPSILAEKIQCIYRNGWDWGWKVTNLTDWICENGENNNEHRDRIAGTVTSTNIETIGDAYINIPKIVLFGGKTAETLVEGDCQLELENVATGTFDIQCSQIGGTVKYSFSLEHLQTA